MSELSHLDCKIYVDASITREELAGRVSALLSATLDRFTAVVPCGEFDIQRNEDFDETRIAEFPDGFLYFRYLIEVYTHTPNDSDCRAFVGKILEHFWSQGVPCVAAGDYENELPNGGGYNSRAVPWAK
jgi:hypothetical protein